MEEQISETLSQPQEAAQPEQPPVLPKKKLNLKIIAILLITISLITISFVAFEWVFGIQIFGKKQMKGGIFNMRIIPQPTEILQPTETVTTSTPDETVNWETYTDEDNGFLFKYPSDWAFKEYPATDVDPKIILVTSNVQGSADTGALGTVTKFMYGVSVSDYRIPSGQDPETYIKNKRMSGASIEEKMIGAYKVFINPESPSMRGAYAFYFERPNKTSYVEFIFDPYSKLEPYPHQNELFSVFDQILSTFKFTD